jgi:antitoxin ParD1/3/4
MNILLTPELEHFVADRLNSGLYHSASGVIRDALRLLREKELALEARCEELNRLIDEGVESLAQGKKSSGEEVFERLKKRSEEFGKRRA